MRFYLDENFPLAAKNLLDAQGHDVLIALDHYPQGTDDEILFEHAQKEKAAFLTTDKDFYHTIPFLYENRTASVVTFVLKQPNRKNILSRLQSFLESVDIIVQTQSVFLVTDRKIFQRE